jgi:hypothetical protein
MSLRTACVIGLSIALLAAGCGTTPSVPTPAPTASTPPPERPRAPGQPPPTVLAAEVQWMKQLFEGTPVVITAETDGAMRVDVPMPYAFDDKSPAPKPPLKAVMDKLAQSLARQASAKVQVATPGPATRSAAMRTYLIGRGVTSLRVVVLASAPSEAVTLRVVPGPVAIEQLDDRALPPPTNAFPAKSGKSS